MSIHHESVKFIKIEGGDVEIHFTNKENDKKNNDNDLKVSSTPIMSCSECGNLLSISDKGKNFQGIDRFSLMKCKCSKEK